jgi:hypothetical protein
MSTALASTTFYPLQIGECFNREVSDKIRSDIKEIRKHADQSIVLGWRQALRDQLADVCHEASVQGWDGYNAEPLTGLAFNAAHRLIDLLPEMMIHPEVVPSPNGEIAFEWDRGVNGLFSIRTHGRLLVYAGLFGTDRKQYGQEPFSDELPRSIATILATYFSEA